ncbi:hypothetical protein [Paraflavitalea sp. CAU 1676]|uniref:hypothetical protein n=1 Tax=Paraflavitalea sp. CAU 1676 TaxID=3032598 RepID=UPI0023DC564B|nr:hypothetical protein [Paraflavitalea sp. CAU 1676]MDF2190166.1 hypothetical protein [Paraflavitalea sp. CAU 1676]
MDNHTNQESGLFNLSIEGASRNLLQTAATWARIVAIIGFISAGISLMSSILAPSQLGAGAKWAGVFINGLFLLIFVVINYFLYRFATHTLASLSNMNQVQFNEGINSLRLYFKLIGILIIIIMALVFILILFAGLGAAVGSR